MQLLKPPLPRKPLQQQNNDTRSKGKNAKGTRANPPKKRNQEVLGDTEDEWEDTPGDSEEEEANEQEQEEEEEGQQQQQQQQTSKRRRR